MGNRAALPDVANQGLPRTWRNIFQPQPGQNAPDGIPRKVLVNQPDGYSSKWTVIQIEFELLKRFELTTAWLAETTLITG
jgi:hypothetical protein